MRIVYLGFNSFKSHKRGVENVIDFQSRASLADVNYYFHWDTKTSIYHYEKFICIGIKKNQFWIITLNLLLHKIKKREKLFFIHSHNPLMSIFCKYQTNLFTVHDALYYLTSSHNYKFKKIFFILEKTLYFRTKFVHFISNYSMQMSLFKADKNFIIIPNTSHLENFKFQIDNTTLKHKFNSSKTKIFTVRSIEERARIDLLIDLAKYTEDSDFEFLIAGKGPLLEFYNDKIKKENLSNIFLLEYVSDNDLIKYYNDCNIVLITAEYGEGFGLPIIEGYLFDKPVIASNRCAIPEIIFSYEFLFENNVQSIFEKLEFAKQNLNKGYKKYYDANFSNNMILKNFEILYKKLN
jgi:glycosyltransferase involved in cell wall biosynthesis